MPKALSLGMEGSKRPDTSNKAHDHPQHRNRNKRKHRSYALYLLAAVLDLRLGRQAHIPQALPLHRLDRLPVHGNLQIKSNQINDTTREKRQKSGGRYIDIYMT